MSASNYNSGVNPSRDNYNHIGPSLDIVERYIQTGVLNGPEPKPWLNESSAELLLKPQNNLHAVSFYPMAEAGNMEIHGISNVYTTPVLDWLLPSTGRVEMVDSTLQKTYTCKRELDNTGTHFANQIIARIVLRQYDDWVEDYVEIAKLKFDVDNASKQQLIISSPVEHLRRGFKWHEPNETEGLVIGSYLSTLIVLALNPSQSVDNRDANL